MSYMQFFNCNFQKKFFYFDHQYIMLLFWVPVSNVSVSIVSDFIFDDESYLSSQELPVAQSDKEKRD